jgi:hypothetical protein
MKKHYVSIGGSLLALCVILWGCGSGSSSSSSDSSTTCSLTSNTSASGVTSTNGCPLMTRDTSSCQASRTAQGLSGFWLKFSCRVTLTKSGDTVTLVSDSQPDYKSPYFGSSNGCYEALSVSGRAVNPNLLSTQAITMTVDYTPSANVAEPTMPGGVIGMALNGVAIFDNEAAPGDSIFTEIATFDKCEGHPNNTGVYHYHSEPTSFSNQDAYFVGVMRDGFPIYGRYDSGAVTPTVDADTQGHSGTTIDSGTSSVGHYHIKLQTSGSDSAYFITNGKYYGTAGTCTGC